MKDREVIAFLGFEATGKTYQASKLVEERGFIKLSFADVLREVAFAVLGMGFEEGMKNYSDLKKTEIYNGQNFRNILENLGSAVRKYSVDFWANAVVEKIKSTSNNICIDDMRYTNEYIIVKNYCMKNGIAFRAYYCDYKSENYRDDNPHESAKLAKYLHDIGYKNLQLINEDDIIQEHSKLQINKLSQQLHRVLGQLKK